MPSRHKKETSQSAEIARLRAALRAMERRQFRQNTALTEITKSDALANGDIDRAFPAICQTVSALLNGDRTSVWLLDADEDTLRPVADASGNADNVAERGPFKLSRYPRYTEALTSGRGLVAHDALTHPLTAEIVHTVLRRRGIVGLLEMPIRVGGRMAGVVNVEHTGNRLEWAPDEYHFVASMADLAALALEARHRRDAAALLRVAKENAEAANRAKGSFLANVSHELRTPLNAIIGFAQFIQDEPYGKLGDRRYNGYLNDIEFAGQHLLGVINGILDTAKAEAGLLHPVAERVALGSLLADTCRIIELQARRRPLHFAVLGPCDLPDLLIDPQRLRQALLNVLSNAIKFTQPGGTVSIEAASTPEGGVAIVIRDTGIGISPDNLTRVFEPFSQIDTQLNRRFDGTGLGLPLARTIVEAHGGSLMLDSALGKGTTVTILLPASLVLPQRQIGLPDPGSP